jgi:hypothetical protein
LPLTNVLDATPKVAPGGDAKTIAAVTSHKSVAMVKHYTESHDQKKRATARNSADRYGLNRNKLG